MTRQLITTAGLVLSLSAATAMSATTINILVGNVDVGFDGSTGQLTDAGDAGNGTPAAPSLPTQVSSIDMEVDRVSEAFLTSGFLDMLVTDLGTDLQTLSFVTGAGGSDDSDAFGLDLFGDGLELRLGIDDINYLIVPSSIPGANLFQFSAQAKVLSQDLPNDRAFVEDVLISYTATDVDFGGSGPISTFTASGQLTITGELVPEPSSFAMILLAGAMAGKRRRRRVG